MPKWREESAAAAALNEQEFIATKWVVANLAVWLAASSSSGQMIHRQQILSTCRLWHKPLELGYMFFLATAICFFTSEFKACCDWCWFGGNKQSKIIHRILWVSKITGMNFIACRKNKSGKLMAFGLQTPTHLSAISFGILFPFPQSEERESQCWNSSQHRPC